MSKNKTIENYLEAIHILSLRKKAVRAIDVAEYLNFSRPTVSVALKQLQSDAYVLIDENHISLSDKGKKIAETMYERHELVAKILMKLGVNEKQAYYDSCLIEHDLSEESFSAIKKAVDKNFF